jgi:hypothetical protein
MDSKHPFEICFQLPPGMSILVEFFILLLCAEVVGCIDAGTAKAVEPVDGFYKLFAIHDYSIVKF